MGWQRVSSGTVFRETYRSRHTALRHVKCALHEQDTRLRGVREVCGFSSQPAQREHRTFGEVGRT